MTTTSATSAVLTQGLLKNFMVLGEMPWTGLFWLSLANYVLSGGRFRAAPTGHGDACRGQLAFQRALPLARLRRGPLASIRLTVPLALFNKYAPCHKCGMANEIEISALQTTALPAPPSPSPAPTLEPPPAARVVVSATKTEREIELESELASERQRRTQTEEEKKRVETDAAYLADENRRLKSVAVPHAPKQKKIGAGWFEFDED